MKHNQTVRPAKQKKHQNITFYTAAEKREVLFKTIKKSEKKNKLPIHPNLNNGRCALRTKLCA